MTNHFRRGNIFSLECVYACRWERHNLPHEYVARESHPSPPSAGRPGSRSSQLERKRGALRFSQVFCSRNCLIPGTGPGTTRQLPSQFDGSARPMPDTLCRAGRAYVSGRFEGRVMSPCSTNHWMGVPSGGKAAGSSGISRCMTTRGQAARPFSCSAATFSATPSGQSDSAMSMNPMRS